MSAERGFLVGLLGALAIGAVVFSSVGDRLTLGLIAMIVSVLGAAAAFGETCRGWRVRLLRGGVGMFLAVAAGAVLVLCRLTDWFDWPDEHGVGLFMILLASFAGVPGALAAVATKPRFGLALAGGFALGLSGLLLLVGGARNIGMVVLLGIGTIVGASVCTLGRRNG